MTTAADTYTWKRAQAEADYDHTLTTIRAAWHDEAIRPQIPAMFATATDHHAARLIELEATAMATAEYLWARGQAEDAGAAAVGRGEAS
jgi:hypothetical protein